MRLPKRGEKGFTLIELLIVVAILGVLAAVVIPNVTRFVGAGKSEAAETELHNIQLAVTSMMLENGITTIPVPCSEVAITDPPTAQDSHKSDMTLFPDSTSEIAEGKVADPHGVLYLFPGTTPTDKPGYLLYGHDITGGGTQNEADLVNYVVVPTTTYHYTCETDGTVKQWDSAGFALVWD